MITIFARNMLTAQGVKLTDEQRAQLTARADRVRAIMTAYEGTLVTDRQVFNLPVVDPSTGANIGLMTFWF